MGTTWGRFSVKATRKDLFVRKPTGVVAEKDDPERDDEALKTLMAETHTVGSKRSTWARLRWWNSEADGTLPVVRGEIATGSSHTEERAIPLSKPVLVRNQTSTCSNRPRVAAHVGQVSG